MMKNQPKTKQTPMLLKHKHKAGVLVLSVTLGLSLTACGGDTNIPMTNQQKVKIVAEKSDNLANTNAGSNAGVDKAGELTEPLKTLHQNILDLSVTDYYDHNQYFPDNVGKTATHHLWQDRGVHYFAKEFEPNYASLADLKIASHTFAPTDQDKLAVFKSVVDKIAFQKISNSQNTEIELATGVCSPSLDNLNPAFVGFFTPRDPTTFWYSNKAVFPAFLKELYPTLSETELTAKTNQVYQELKADDTAVSVNAQELLKSWSIPIKTTLNISPLSFGFDDKDGIKPTALAYVPVYNDTPRTPAGLAIVNDRASYDGEYTIIRELVPASLRADLDKHPSKDALLKKYFARPQQVIYNPTITHACLQGYKTLQQGIIGAMADNNLTNDELTQLNNQAKKDIQTVKDLIADKQKQLIELINKQEHWWFDTH